MKRCVFAGIKKLGWYSVGRVRVSLVLNTVGFLVPSTLSVVAVLRSAPVHWKVVIPGGSKTPGEARPGDPVVKKGTCWLVPFFTIIQCYKIVTNNFVGTSMILNSEPLSLDHRIVIPRSPCWFMIPEAQEGTPAHNCCFCGELNAWASHLETMPLPSRWLEKRWFPTVLVLGKNTPQKKQKGQKSKAKTQTCWKSHTQATSPRTINKKWEPPKTHASQSPTSWILRHFFKF